MKERLLGSADEGPSARTTRELVSFDAERAKIQDDRNPICLIRFIFRRKSG
jgi:hypothetical protein